MVNRLRILVVAVGLVLAGCGGSGRKEASRRAHEDAAAMVVVLDTIHGINERLVQYWFRERALAFDTVALIRMANESHDSVTVAAINALPFVDIDHCSTEYCEVPPGDRHGSPRSVVCSVPHPVPDGVEVYCVDLVNAFGEIHAAGFYMRLRQRADRWHVEHLHGLYIN